MANKIYYTIKNTNDITENDLYENPFDLIENHEMFNYKNGSFKENEFYNVQKKINNLNLVQISELKEYLTLVLNI